MTTPTASVNFSDALVNAWERMLNHLFRPFNPAHWFWLGLCAYLAYWGEQGGGFNFAIFPTRTDSEHYQSGMTIQHEQTGDQEESNVSIHLPNGKTIDADELRGQVREWWNDAKASAVVWTIVAIALVILAFLIAFMLVMSWIKARFEFILMDNLCHSRAEIAEPWQRFGAAGWSLFLWRLIFNLVAFCVGLLLAGLCLGLPLMLGWSSITSGQMQSGGITAIALGVLLILFVLLPVIIVGMIICWLTRYFVVPLMLRHGITATAAWGRLLPLLRANLGAFCLLALLFLAIDFAAGFFVMLVMLATCCLCCTVLIPVIGGIGLAIVTLPATIFLRLLCVEFLAQIGPAHSPLEQPLANPTPGAIAAA